MFYNINSGNLNLKTKNLANIYKRLRRTWR
ncbi:hypothetical protein EMIT0P100_70153 [Pseudomonas sp. IT-P100]